MSNPTKNTSTYSNLDRSSNPSQKYPWADDNLPWADDNLPWQQPYTSNQTKNTASYTNQTKL